jgi:hypothetical protein
MSPRTLLNKLHGAPFRPFRVRLTNNTTLDVNDPGVVMVGPTSAIMPIQTTKDDLGYTLVTQWRTVALSHIVEFADLEPPKPPLKLRDK